MTCPVASSPGSGTFIAIVIELGFFTTNATSTLLTFSGMYLNHNRYHVLFQYLSGFGPIFYTTHTNEEPIFFALTLSPLLMHTSINPSFLVPFALTLLFINFNHTLIISALHFNLSCFK